MKILWLENIEALRENTAAVRSGLAVLSKKVVHPG
jgi:hypothetical protein